MKIQRLYCACILVLSLFQLHAQQYIKITDSPISTTPGDSRSVNWIDVNRDGYVDCFISNGPQTGQNNMLYINDQQGNFIAVTDDPIVKDNQPSDGATFADIDNDGDEDAFVVNWYNRNNLAYLNNGDGSFTQITEGPWVTQGGFSETASFGDFDHDGLVDLYVTNSAGSKRNFLYHNDGNASMTPVTTGVHVTDVSSSRNVTWVDMDQDGDSDLFVTNESNEKNQVYRNDGNGVFTKLTDVALTTTFASTMSSCWGDTDNDGDLDVFLANDGSANQYFRNDGNFVFTPVLTSDITAGTANAFGCAWADIDNDADLDLFVTHAFKAGTRLRNQLFLNDGTGHLIRDTAEVVTKDLGWSYGCAFGDYDNNGFMDLAVATTRYGNTDETDYLYHNQPNDNHYLMFSLEGTASNRSAIGTIVKVKANIAGQPVWQMREVSAQSGYCGQNDMRVHVGLGDAVQADSVIIKWPSGHVEYQTKLAADQILHIKESMINQVSDPKVQIQFLIYPNPAYSSVTMQMKTAKVYNNVHCEIANDTGLIVYRMDIEHIDDKWEMLLSLSQLGLSQGTYFVRLYNQQIDETRKLVYTPK